MTPQEMASWYQEAMSEAGWSLSSDPQTTSTSIHLSYQQGEDEVQIKMTAVDSGSQVEILFQGTE